MRKKLYAKLFIRYSQNDVPTIERESIHLNRLAGLASTRFVCHSCRTDYSLRIQLRLWCLTDMRFSSIKSVCFRINPIKLMSSDWWSVYFNISPRIHRTIFPEINLFLMDKFIRTKKRFWFIPRKYEQFILHHNFHVKNEIFGKLIFSYFW